MTPFCVPDVAVEDGTGTTVYGQHATGNGNNPDLKKSAWKKRSLAEYIKDDAPCRETVVILRRKIDAPVATKITAYANWQWANDTKYSAHDDNCSQNVAYILKDHKLLAKWKGKKNEINDDDFKYPEGDLLDDWLSKDDEWESTGKGYLTLKPAASLYESWQKDKPGGCATAEEEKKCGSSSS